MTQKTALLIAAGLTAFVLVVVSAVVVQATAAPPALDATQVMPTQASTQEVSAPPAAGAESGAAAQAAPQATPTYPVTARMAALIALNTSPRTRLLKMPELVQFQGAVAYEVVTDVGQFYVDATSGQLLYSPVAPAAGGGFGGGDDHQGGGDDDGGGFGG